MHVKITHFLFLPGPAVRILGTEGNGRQRDRNLGEGWRRGRLSEQTREGERKREIYRETGRGTEVTRRDRRQGRETEESRMEEHILLLGVIGRQKAGESRGRGSRLSAPTPLPPAPRLAPGSPEVFAAREATPAGRAQRAGRTGTAAAWAPPAAPSIRRSPGLASGGVCGNYLLIS